MNYFLENKQKTSFMNHSIQERKTGNIFRMFYESEDKGFLDYLELNGMYFLLSVEINESYKMHGIASKLLKEFFSIVEKRDGFLDYSEFIQYGEKYLQPIFKKFVLESNNIKFA